MSAFTEDLHPRGGDGKFATKAVEEIDGGLVALDEGMDTCDSCGEQVSYLSSDRRCDGCTEADAQVAARLAEGDEPDVRFWDKVAEVMGSEHEWDDVGDYLDPICDKIVAMGRPHPGDWNADRDGDYADALRQAGFGRARRDSDAGRLDALATHLAATEHWGADELDAVSEMVAASGRPDFNTDPDDYADALHRWRLEQGYDSPSAHDRAHALAEAADLPVMGGVLATMSDRGIDVDSLGTVHVRTMYTDHVGPLIDTARPGRTRPRTRT
ncbi:hypothetical protein [Isoptericola croceus]|uniref:hypothetical protein n=1 Tax=Isoptericola croceus TaxID=3031406 RepID=UPI0023F62F09|nr:hypothetical protein [Isoptericola croceus]